jgi:hypothetical protein
MTSAISFRVSLFVAAAVCGSALVFACSSSTTPPLRQPQALCTGPFVASSAPSPVVKVTKAEVDDIVSSSCTFTHSCHGAGSPASRLQLPKPPSEWAANVIGQKSTENPAMKIVAPGDPSHSWLAQKITNGSCSFTSVCTKDTIGCGDQMPQTGDPLPDADIATFIEWIRQGAVTK